MNSSMFGKNDESITASSHMKNKKDIYLYRSRSNNSQQIQMTSNSTIGMVKSYETFLSTVKGYKQCSDLSCNYTTYLENATDKIKTENIDDWYVTSVNYTGLQLDALNNPLEKSEMLGGTNWPYNNTRGGEVDCGLKTPYFVENHTYFNKDISNQTVYTEKGTGAFKQNNSLIYAKNKSFEFPNTKLTE
jgi:hypothetical protein